MRWKLAFIVEIAETHPAETVQLSVSAKFTQNEEETNN
jgi:hypothetical protein